jgi:hypothetical protein
MSKLLNLVDQLIGSLLQGNVYTNTDTYTATMLQSPPNVGPPPEVRNGLYTQPGVPPDVATQKTNQAQQPSPSIDRNKIYNDSDSLNRKGNPLNDLLNFHDSVANDPSFSKGAAFDSTRRNEVFKTPNSNVGGTSISRQTLGDVQNQAGKPAAPSLLFNGQDDAPGRDSIAGERGDIGNNLFDDGFGIGGKFASLTQRPIPPQLRYADVIAAAHWAANVGRELTGIGEESAGTGNVQDNIEGAIKGVTFLANQFLLASMNPGGILSDEPTNLGLSNGVYNPLAIPVSMFARVYDPDIAPIVAGPLVGGGYKSALTTQLIAETDVLSNFGAGVAATKDLPGDPPSPLGTLPARVAEEVQKLTGEFIDPLDARFSGEDKESLRTSPITDGEIYVPLMFQDLRDTTPKYLYFRAFLKPGLAETFTPDWQLERYYGRVDQIPIYQGTTRSINMAFDVVAWKPEDLPVMWRKLKKLQSMVYPFYNGRGFLNSGPIVRMRVGDLIAGQGGKGLPGYITSMDWSYDDGIWNTEVDAKIPRKVSVSLGFTVLHEGNPGTYPYAKAEKGIDDPEVPSQTTEGYTFGAAKHEKKGDATTITVSPSELRKIFKSQGS